MNRDNLSCYEENNVLLKKNLKSINNIKGVFNNINQHLYGKLKYTHTDTRARSKEIINLLFCKLVDEISKSPEEPVDVCIKNNETQDMLFRRINSFFKKKVKDKYKDIIRNEEKINLNKDLLYLIIQELQTVSLINSSKDILSDAFEIFVSRILKEEGGQFFTPSNVVGFMVKYLDPNPTDKVLDPACGHGGFLFFLNFLFSS